MSAEGGTVYYKVLNEDGTSCYGRQCTWSLPTQNDDGTWTPGEWMPAIEGELVPCVNGYHLCRGSDLLGWLGPAVFEAEYCGEMVEAPNKVVVREARLLRRLNWDERVARLFACDCAERVLHVYECDYPDDPRPRRAIEVARRYANGEATDEQLTAACRGARAAAKAIWAAARTARAAAWAAARDAAWAAAVVAARAAAGDAARAAAWDAVGDDVWDDAWDGAWDAERQWQTERLLVYLEGRL